MKTLNIPSLALSLFLVVACSPSNNSQVEGKIKRETISIAPKYAGRVAKIFVAEGDNVKAGDTLAILDIPEVLAKKQQAEGALYAATWQHQMALKGATKEQREQVDAAFQAASDQYELAEKSLKRVRNLFNDSLVPAQTYDEALTKFQMARAQLDAATAKKQEVFGGLRNEQIQMALGQKKHAEGAVNEASVVMAERFVVAPKDMTIETIALHEGELALPGYNFFIGNDIHTTWVRLTVGESMMQNFKKGASYTFTTTYNNQTIETTLTAVNELAKYGARTSSYPNYQPGETVYELKFTPKQPSQVMDLYTNMSVRTSIAKY
jgi:HlyD family secretion protein